MLTLTQTIPIQQESRPPLWEVQVESYPKEEVAFGDIVFLRYEYKNVSDSELTFDYARDILSPSRFRFFARFQDAHQEEVKGGWSYVKDGSFSRFEPFPFGFVSIHSLQLQPNETFTMYEAVLAPSPARNFISSRMGGSEPEKRHPFWNFSENSKMEWNIESRNFLRIEKQYHHLLIVPRLPTQEMQFFKDWFDNRLEETTYNNSTRECISNNSVYAAVDPILPKVFKDVTPEGLQELLDGLSSGTFRDLIQLHASLGLGSVEDPEKPFHQNPKKPFIDSYQSPNEKFWAWFDELPEIERNFFAVAVVKAYCPVLLYLAFPDWLGQDQELVDNLVFRGMQDRIQAQYKISELEYALRQEKYDRFIADWLPRLPQENGEGKEIIRLLERLRKEKEKE